MLLEQVKKYNPELNEEQLKTRKFGIETIVNELSKIIIYLVIFSLFSLTLNYLLSLIVYSSIRSVSGGYHARSYWGCLVTSFVTFAVTVFLGKYLFLSISARVLLIAAALIITIIFAPVSHMNTPKKSRTKPGRFKVWSVVLVLFWASFVFLLPDMWSITITITIFVEALMQPLGKLLNPLIKAESGA
jgi:accessory gene regulator B